MNNPETLAVREAISTLGYLKPDAEADIAKILPLCFRYGPRAVATKYRKHGEQISDDEKRALGLRRNAFYSRRVFSLLTEKGRSSPIEGIVLTLSRAGHILHRQNAIDGAQKVADAKIMMVGFDMECEGCQRSNKQIIETRDASPLPPNDCRRENCGLMFNVHIDFLARWNEP